MSTEENTAKPTVKPPRLVALASAGADFVERKGNYIHESQIVPTDQQPTGVEKMRITSTPWGQPDQQAEIAPGIIFVSTPSHGGYFLTRERRAMMPKKYNRDTFAGGDWFEEDCDWALVALSFPEYFDARALDAARATLAWMDRDKAAA